MIGACGVQTRRRLRRHVAPRAILAALNSGMRRRMARAALRPVVSPALRNRHRAVWIVARGARKTPAAGHPAFGLRQLRRMRTACRNVALAAQRLAIEGARSTRRNMLSGRAMAPLASHARFVQTGRAAFMTPVAFARRGRRARHFRFHVVAHQVVARGARIAARVILSQRGERRQNRDPDGAPYSTTRTLAG